MISLILTALLTACTRQVGWVGLNYLNTLGGSYQFFDGKKIERIQVNAGDNFSLNYDIEIDDGALRIELVDPDREVVVVRFQAEKSGRYTLRINGDQTKGGFELRWETPDKSISLDYFRAGFVASRHLFNRHPKQQPPVAPSI